MKDRIKWKDVRYFLPDEFDDPNHPGSGKEIDGILLFQLERLRHTTKWPIITHSAVGGCIDVDGSHGHSEKSYHLLKQGACACDFHFQTDIDVRIQCLEVEMLGFPGVGFYFDWHWNGVLLPIGFHVDMRPKHRAQRWTRKAHPPLGSKYFYWWQ